MIPYGKALEGFPLCSFTLAARGAPTPALAFIFARGKVKTHTRTSHPEAVLFRHVFRCQKHDTRQPKKYNHEG